MPYCIVVINNTVSLSDFSKGTYTIENEKEQKKLISARNGNDSFSLSVLRDPDSPRVDSFFQIRIRLHISTPQY